MAENHALCIVPLNKGAKTPMRGLKWTKYRGLGQQYPIKLLKRHQGNFGIICGDPVKWGTGYLTILDIDNKDLYPIFEDIDTLHVKSASKGYHLYFWSKEEVKDKNRLARMFNMDIELRGTAKYYTVLPPSKIQLKNNNIGHHKVIKEPEEFQSFMDVENAEKYLKEKIEAAGYKTQTKELIETPVKDNGGVEDVYTSPLQLSRRWEHHISPEDIEKIVELLKPFYHLGQRQNLCLWLSGWMHKAEISYQSALKVIKLLTQNDEPEEVKQRQAALRNSYRGLEKKALRGSSGIYGILQKELTNPEDVLKTYGIIYRLIVHPLSILGVQQALKELRKKFEQENISKVHDFLENRYQIIKDDPSWQHWIYNTTKGVYEQHNDDQFLEFLIQVFGKEIFTLQAAKTLKSMFGRVRKESSQYIAFNNCLLNLDTLKPNEFTSDEFVTFRIPYDWNPQAQGELVEKKLQEILIDQKGDQKECMDKYIQYLQMVGYCIVENRNPRQKMFLIFGNAGTGKTQLVQLLAGLFPDSVSSVPLQRFQEQFGLAPLLNKRINTLYDISQGEINDPSVIKAVTGGDSMTIDRKYKEAVTYPQGLPVKTIGSGNELPRIDDISRAMFERIITIELKNKFRGTQKEMKDLELYQQLLKEDEGMSWLIHQAINEYKKIKDNNQKFQLEKGVNEMEKEYLRVSDPCKYAANLLFEKSNDEHDYYTRQEIVQLITQHLQKEGLRIPTANSHFYNAIRAIGGEDTKRKILDNTERGFMLVKARENVMDPAKTRLQNQTIIESIEKIDMQGRHLEDLTIREREILEEVLNHLQKFKEITIQGLLNDLNIEGYNKKQVKETLETWKQKGYLKVNNKHYQTKINN
jgi:putative DNA primase/helicase